MPNVPFFRDDHMIGRYFENIWFDRQKQISNLTQNFTQEAIDFIQKQSNECKPFFLYFTPDNLHAPTYRSLDYVGKSKKQSSYGDALIEIDHSIGRILDLIRGNDQLKDNTFVFFTSDNGPALTSAPDAGSNGPLLCGKQTTFEGGFREPAIAWWPGRIKPGTTSGQVTNMMDLYRTIANLAQAPMPSNRFYDSNDLSPLLFHNEPIKNASVFYYRGDTLMAIRHGPYKAHYWTFTNPWEEFKKKIDYCPGNEVQNVTTHKLTHHQSPVLFHLIRDPGERFPIPIHRYEYTNAIKKLETIKIEHERTMVRGEPVLNICDRAAMLWSPPGCEKIDMCLPVPKSAPYDCIWPH